MTLLPSDVQKRLRMYSIQVVSLSNNMSGSTFNQAGKMIGSELPSRSKIEYNLKLLSENATVFFKKKSKISYRRLPANSSVYPGFEKRISAPTRLHR